MSNQVYSNINGDIPYFGDVYTRLVTVTGLTVFPQVPTAVTAQMSFRGWRTSLVSAAFMITATQPNVAWATTATVVAAPGTIPVAFRPTIPITAPIMIVSTALDNSPAFNGFIVISNDGAFRITKIDGQTGDRVTWSLNDQVGAEVIDYFIGTP